MAIAWLVIVESALLAYVGQTVYNVVYTLDDYACGGFSIPLPGFDVHCELTVAEKALYLLAAVVVLGLIAWSWWLIAGWMLRPLSATAHTVRRLGPHNLGQPVPAEALPTLFEPFKRLGADRVRTGGRGGVGLGLAIVRSIALAHQGTISARPRSAGGLEIEVALPARASAAAWTRRATLPDAKASACQALAGSMSDAGVEVGHHGFRPGQLLLG